MKYFVYQGNSGDCGFAATKMLLASIHKDKRFLNLKKPDFKRKDYSIKDLINILEDNGAIAKAYQYERKFDIIDKDSTKFLALIKTQDNKNHVVMVNKFKDCKLEIFDPDKGIYTLSFESFLSVWSGYTIEVIEHRKLEKRLPKVINTKKALKNYDLIISIISILFLCFGVFFLNYKSSILMPLIFIICFSLFELASRICSIRELEKFDSLYLRKLSLIPCNFEDEYRKYNDFKKIHFTLKKNFLTNIIVIGLVMILLILNSPYHSIPLLILLIITVFDRFVLQRNSGKKVDEINSLEENVLKEKDIKNRYVLLNQLHHNSYSYAFGISSRKCVYTFIIISCAFIMSAIQNTLTANALIFEFFMFNVYFEYLDKLLGYVNEKSKYQKLLAHFIDTFVY